MTHQPMDAAVPDHVLSADEARGVRNALLRYRFMAYLVGTLLIVLVCVGVPLKYIRHDDRVVTWTGVPHGWLYMILIGTAYDLGRRVRWPWSRLIVIALAGTVPFLSFVAEHNARRNVHQYLDEHTGGADADRFIDKSA